MVVRQWLEPDARKLSDRPAYAPISGQSLGQIEERHRRISGHARCDGPGEDRVMDSGSAPALAPVDTRMAHVLPLHHVTYFLRDIRRVLPHPLELLPHRILF